MYVINRPRSTRFVLSIWQSGSALFGALLLKHVLFKMYNYFRPVLLRAPLQHGALSARLVRLWVNPSLNFACHGSECPDDRSILRRFGTRPEVTDACMGA